eukprot:8738000-Prorocentrum_lima.AAC.1
MKLKSPPAIVDVFCWHTCWQSSCATVKRVLPNVYPCSMCKLTMSIGKSGENSPSRGVKRDAGAVYRVGSVVEKSVRPFCERVSCR